MKTDMTVRDFLLAFPDDTIYNLHYIFVSSLLKDEEEDEEYSAEGYTVASVRYPELGESHYHGYPEAYNNTLFGTKIVFGAGVINIWYYVEDLCGSP